MRLEGKVAIVTGATYGIGRGSAIEIAKEGAKVVVNGRNRERGMETVKMIESIGGEAIFIKADVSKEDEVRDLINQTVKNFGKLDILFNNAGIQYFKNFLEMPIKEWDETFAINVRGQMLCAKYSVPEMEKAGKGVILNCASVASFVALGGCTAYVATKGAILAMTRDMAVDLAKKNIRVLAIAPGTVKSGSVEKAISDGWATEKSLGSFHLKDRMGTPEEQGKVVAFLVSDDASWMMGNCVLVDGGYTLL
jgi:NAD(P)-dependent dehydrogenase (short-subunit alcohol dehydrogenase family)